MKRALLALLALLLACACVCASADAAQEKHSISRFYYSRGGSMMPQSVEILLTEDGFILSENDGAARPLDAAFAEDIETLLEKHRVDEWDGFHESDPRVLDGEAFVLVVEYLDGAGVYASGENAFPDGYYKAVEELTDLLQREKWAFLSGVYAYEGEGFGGDFTITLNADGTYRFYEGPLSSYIGLGSWDVYYDALYLYGDEEAGSDLDFVFGLREGSLIYLAQESDAFPYVKLPDGAKFSRQDPKEDAMKLFINDTAVPVTWEDNASVEALRQLLPLTVRMSMYGGFEQVGPIGQSLPRSDRQTETAPGDIVLYSGNQIVIFYGENAWSYTRLGHVDLSPKEMADLLSRGNVTLKIALQN